MTRVEAYHILGKMSAEEWVSAEQAEALYIAQKDIEYVDLMPNDMTLVVRCKDCKYYREGEYFENTKFCFRLKHGEEYVGYNFSEDDFCSYAERR